MLFSGSTSSKTELNSENKNILRVGNSVANARVTALDVQDEAKNYSSLIR